jgi:hypothetical protein
VEKPKNKATARKVGRDAKTGRFKSRDYVKKHPATTVEETVVVPKRKKRKK